MNILARARRVLGLLRRLPASARGMAVRRLLESSSSRQRRLERALAVKPSSIVFICHGNIMRSAFALAYARQQFPDMAASMLGGGTHAVHGRAAQQSALVVAREMGTPLDGHSATPLGELRLDEGALILCMDRANEANVATRLPALADRVFLIGDVDPLSGTQGSDATRVVSDPYALGDGATRQAFQRIAELVGQWAAAVGARRAG